MAIVLVLLFHFEIFNFTGGYIGVDIFFVISGYLITKIILKKKKILEFYYNRVRRIFPALLITTTITLFTAIFIFSPNHFEKLVTTSLYSVTGISNFYFWYHSGYFDIDKIVHRIKNKIDPFDRPRVYKEIPLIKKNFPKFIIDNRNFLKKWII
jgi:peptidoglycan/LPS O-acetylase OafA/YrhL